VCSRSEKAYRTGAQGSVSAHNAFLQIGVELGIPGLALFVFLLYRAVKTAVAASASRDNRRELAMEAWLARGCGIVGVWVYRVGFSLFAGVLEHSVPTSRNFGVLYVSRRTRPGSAPRIDEQAAGDTAASLWKTP